MGLTWWDWHTNKDTIKRYFKFTSEEIRALILSIVIMTFIFAFNDGSDSFSAFKWGINFCIMFGVVAISVLIQQTGHRLSGIVLGFKVEYKIWWNGLVIGIVAAIITRGNFWILAPGGIFIHHMAVHRLGYLRYQTNMMPLGITAAMGPIFNIVFAAMIKTIGLIMNSTIGFYPAIIDKIVLFNLAYAAYALIPIPPLPGSRILFTGRMLFVFIASCFICYAILYALGIYSFIYAIILGIIIHFIFFFVFERKAVKVF